MFKTPSILCTDEAPAHLPSKTHALCETLQDCSTICFTQVDLTPELQTCHKSVDQKHALALRSALRPAICLLTESGDDSKYQSRSGVRADVQRALLQVPISYQFLQSTDNSSLNDSHVGSSLT
jgi:hypothetical protein